MVNYNARCVIVAASPQNDQSFIKSQISNDDFIICADGGADALISTGVTPDLIIGDFDSSQHYKVFNDTKTVTLPTCKDDTDTMYCVKTALDMGYRNFLLLGATGGRLDHTLANLSVLLFLDKYNAMGVISDEYGDTMLLHHGDNPIKNMKGRTASVMPFACNEVCLSYKGMKYPLDNDLVSAEYPFTISNVIIDELTVVTLHSGNALLVLPRSE